MPGALGERLACLVVQSALESSVSLLCRHVKKKKKIVRQTQQIYMFVFFTDKCKIDHCN
jgi:hypothetical protein